MQGVDEFFANGLIKAPVTPLKSNIEMMIFKIVYPASNMASFWVSMLVFGGVLLGSCYITVQFQ